MDVGIAIKELKSTVSAGPDLIPSFVFKACSEHLRKPLCCLFNQILRTCNFPKLFQISRVCPVPKQANVAQIENYRPVAIGNCLNQIFERILSKHIYNSVQAYISEEQHGFLK